MSTIKVQNIQHTASSTNAIALASDGTGTANITDNLSNKNLIQNGAFLISQRGTSSTANGYGSVDRFSVLSGGTDEAPTHAQVDVASGTTPYTLGFRKALKITNGNQTSVGADDYIVARTVLEAQDIANSGWNYLSTSSSITISFWVKSSVAQNFYVNLWSQDGTQYNYIFETGSLSADTWTKVTKTIIGNSNLQFDNNSNAGLRIQLVAFYGTNKTGSVSLNTWAAFSGSTITPDMTNTWYDADNATLEITGVQLEVSDHATDFEHRSYGQELQLCRRYYQNIIIGDNASGLSGSPYTSSGGIFCPILFSPTMRANPTVVSSSTSGHFRTRHGDLVNFDGFTGFNTVSVDGGTLISEASGTKVVGDFYWVEGNNSGTVLAVNSEL